MIDIGECMCYGEHCELCKTVESQTLPLKQIIHYMLKKEEEEDSRRGRMKEGKSEIGKSDEPGERIDSEKQTEGSRGEGGGGMG